MALVSLLYIQEKPKKIKAQEHSLTKQNWHPHQYEDAKVKPNP
jgi:hypothetical protein